MNTPDMTQPTDEQIEKGSPKREIIAAAIKPWAWQSPPVATELTIKAGRKEAFETADRVLAALSAQPVEGDEIKKKDRIIEELNAVLVACEQACWKEGQTVQGLNKAIRRAVGKYVAGKNPVKAIIDRTNAAKARAKLLETILGTALATEELRGLEKDYEGDWMDEAREALGKKQ